MKVYVASPGIEMKTAKYIMHAVRSSGHEITFDWSHMKKDGGQGMFRPDWRDHREEGRVLSELERDGVLNANLLILNLPTEEHRTRGLGAYIEFGVAAGQKKTIWVVGFETYSRDSLFFSLPEIHFLTYEEMETALQYAKDTEESNEAALKAGSPG